MAKIRDMINLNEVGAVSISLVAGAALAIGSDLASIAGCRKLEQGIAWVIVAVSFLSLVLLVGKYGTRQKRTALSAKVVSFGERVKKPLVLPLVALMFAGFAVGNAVSTAVLTLLPDH